MIKKNSPTFYELLEVQPDDDVITIRLSYLRLVQKYHPENAEFGSHSKFNEITEAWKVVSDPLKRAVYDESLKLDAIEKNAELIDFTP